MKKIVISILLILMGIHIGLGLQAIKWFSPTYDEPLHLTSGYVYLKTADYRINGLHHPPFGEMLSAFPLLFLNPFIPVQNPAWLAQNWSPVEQYNFADKFLYSNRVESDRMMAWGRFFQLLFSCLFILALFFIALKFSNVWGALMSAALWAFSPTSIAHSTLVSTDLVFAVFFFLFFAALNFFPNRRGAIICGLFLGLCFASKYLAISIIPALIAIVFWEFMVRKNRQPARKVWIFSGLAGLAALMVIFIVYQFQSLDVFWAGLSRIVGRSQAGRSSFLMGQHSVSGWIKYFPVVFLIKTPLPVLLGFILGIFLMIKNKVRIPSYLWIPPVLFFVLACTSKVQIGHRHILAIYPFIFLLIGMGLSRDNWARSLGGILILWTLTNSILISPNFLAFFNEAAGGAKNGYKYLTDSNDDWGQGLKELSCGLTSEDKQNGIYLNYFGVADPHAEGIKYLNVGSDSLVRHKDSSDEIITKPTKFAISVTNLQGTYYQNPEVFSWLNNYKPVKNIGYSMFLYDFKDNPEAIKKLDEIRGRAQ